MPASTRTEPLPVSRTEPLVRVAAELSWFGRWWLGFGLAVVAADAAGGWLFDLTGKEIVVVGVVGGLTIASALGGLLLAKRTGPAILYARLLFRAPAPPGDYPREEPARTARRVLAPALVLVLALMLMSPLGPAGLLLLVGERRDEVLDHLAAASLALAGTWTLVCGLTALRMAHYFRRWERRYGKAAFCLPLRAGAMRPVYYVDEPEPRPEDRC